MTLAPCCCACSISTVGLYQVDEVYDGFDYSPGAFGFKR